jgi:nitrilase
MTSYRNLNRGCGRINGVEHANICTECPDAPASGEQIHSAMYPGSAFGEGFAMRMEIDIRQHALESGAFVVNATAWLDADQQEQIMKDTGCEIGPISGGCFTAIVAPDGTLL